MTEQEFEVTGGRVVVDLITMEDDRLGLVFEFHAESDDGKLEALDLDRQRLQARVLTETDRANSHLRAIKVAEAEIRDLSILLERERVGASELETALIEERRKYDREVAAHRENCVLLRAAEAERDEMASAFMALHTLAKMFASPKIPSPTGKTVTVQFNKLDPEVIALMTGEKIDYNAPHPNGGTWPGRAQLADLGG